MTEREDQIRVRAVQLWEDAGKPMFRDQEFWLAAEQQVDSDSQTPAEYQESAMAEQQERTEAEMEARAKAPPVAPTEAEMAERLVPRAPPPTAPPPAAATPPRR